MKIDFHMGIILMISLMEKQGAHRVFGLKGIHDFPWGSF